MRTGSQLLAGLAAFAVAGATAEGWPMLRGNPQRTGFVPEELPASCHLEWVLEFPNERLGTAMEPIVAAGNVFVATHAGRLHALDAASGEPRWAFAAHGPFLHSPAVGGPVAVAASEDGFVYGLERESGRVRWRASGGAGGFAASPLIDAGRVFVGTRQGEFLGLSLESGEVLWRQPVGAPIRQSAAAGKEGVFVTAEDLRTRRFAPADGRLEWTSEPLGGQSARDYYPVIAGSGERTVVIVRTSPALNMAQRLGRDRSLLCRQAGVDDSHWQKLEAWTRGESARGAPELWEREQAALRQYLGEHPEAQTFHVLDARTGQSAALAPILWAAGCQGVGSPAAATADGPLVVLYRSAYGNWNLGVAPLVALGLLDPGAGRIAPLFHTGGRQPPWNTFWGTADESQNFSVAGHAVLIAHQGTLSALDLRSRRLFALHGERDTYGGWPSPPWARNEWHGPARGSAAFVQGRLYWITGSRLVCLAGGPATGPSPVVRAVEASLERQIAAPILPTLAAEDIRERLAAAVREVLSRPWAPLLVEPGLAGREFFFGDSAELFAALAWAWPHLPGELQAQVKTRLDLEWVAHPPASPAAVLSLREGARRERHTVSEEMLVRLGHDRLPHPFAGVYAAWLYGERCGEQARLREAWGRLRGVYEDFRRSGWRLDPDRGDLHANRYLGALVATAALARAAGDRACAQEAETRARDTAQALGAWWRRAARQGTLTRFKGASELDPFIGQGDALSFRVAPHRHKWALFLGLTPEGAARVRAEAPDAVGPVWNVFVRLHATWWLAGEERQVHYGENSVDPPDLSLGAFCALAWLREAPGAELARKVDLPFCAADLGWVTKLALALEAEAPRSAAPPSVP